MESSLLARRAAQWAGFSLDDRQCALLEGYGTWLLDEAIPAGGLGPREGSRLWTRHLGDSLVFAAGWDEAPHEILDVGTGVGLPGIPLAILWPDCVITLLDRGARRIRLLQRVVRMLALSNVVIVQADVFAVADEWAGLVFRGGVRAAEAVGLSARLLTPGGTAVLGVSRRAELPERSADLVGIAEAMGLAARMVEVPAAVLDGAAWLLIMHSRD
jgi:16S rRNA (guanine527-N7)-methyltransferase